MGMLWRIKVLGSLEPPSHQATKPLKEILGRISCDSRPSQGKRLWLKILNILNICIHRYTHDIRDFFCISSPPSFGMGKGGGGRLENVCNRTNPCGCTRATNRLWFFILLNMGPNIVKWNLHLKPNLGICFQGLLLMIRFYNSHLDILYLST